MSFLERAVHLGRVAASVLAVPSLAILFLTTEPPTAQSQAPAATTAVTAPGGPVTSGGNALNAQQGDIFDRLYNARNRTAFVGTRRSLWFENVQIERSSAQSLSGRHLVYSHETYYLKPPASAGGKPLFAIDIHNVDSPGLNEKQCMLRKAQLQSIEGFSHHYGGFAIRNPIWARKNYRALKSPFRITRFGRKATVYDFLPYDQTRSSYRIVIDDLTMIVLDEAELSPSGAMLSSKYYFTASFASQAKFPSTISWWMPWQSVQDYGSLNSAARKAHIRPLLPASGLDGFTSYEYRVATHAATRQKYLVISYSDGIANRFLLEASMSPLQFERNTGAVANPKLVRIFHCQMGPAPQFYTYYKGRAIILIGSFPEKIGDGSKDGLAVVPDMLHGILQ